MRFRVVVAGWVGRCCGAGAWRRASSNRDCGSIARTFPATICRLLGAGLPIKKPPQAAKSKPPKVARRRCFGRTPRPKPKGPKGAGGLVHSCMCEAEGAKKEANERRAEQQERHAHYSFPPPLAFGLWPFLGANLQYEPIEYHSAARARVSFPVFFVSSIFFFCDWLVVHTRDTHTHNTARRPRISLLVCCLLLFARGRGRPLADERPPHQRTHDMVEATKPAPAHHKEGHAHGAARHTQRPTNALALAGCWLVC